MPEDVVDLGDGVLEIKDAKIELHNGEYVRITHSLILLDDL